MHANDFRTAVHLWMIRCGGPGSESRGGEWLSAEEHARAERFRSAGQRAHFRASHAALRAILAGYLGCSPEAVGFRTGSLGKPALIDTEPDLRFNLSHAGDLAMVGVAGGRELGVDLECVPSNELVQETERLVFTQRERRRLAAIPEQERRCREFAQLWSRKEAYLKALGAGLGLQLTDIDVSGPGDRVWVRDGSRGEWRPSSRWTLQSILVGDRYAGAVAAEGSGWQLRYYSWPEDAAQGGCSAAS
jgi:4'-phosphopantetheinyl transferase